MKGPNGPGRCRTAAGYELRRYPVVLVEGRPHAALPAVAARRSWSEILREHARSGAFAKGPNEDDNAQLETAQILGGNVMPSEIADVAG